MFQSTPPRGGRRGTSLALDRVTREVSIHAPARGATRAFRRHPRGAMFQSTPPRGGRPRLLAQRPGAGVSIHAPARGATGAPALGAATGRCFNPRPRAGGDRGAPPDRQGRLRSFNPRPRAGGDAMLRAYGACREVSIHAPARGATRATVRHPARREVSIHAPARGATC